jgi:hypothetical protein
MLFSPAVPASSTGVPRSTKLASRWRGPYRVTAVHGDQLYSLAPIGVDVSDAPSRVHVQRLRRLPARAIIEPAPLPSAEPATSPAAATAPPSAAPPPTAPTAEHDDAPPPPAPELFPAERLLARRRRNGRVEYLVRWLNYGPSDDTWVPDSNVEPALVQEFVAKRAQRQR